VKAPTSTGRRPCDTPRRLLHYYGQALPPRYPYLLPHDRLCALIVASLIRLQIWLCFSHRKPLLRSLPDKRITSMVCVVAATSRMFWMTFEEMDRIVCMWNVLGGQSLAGDVFEPRKVAGSPPIGKRSVAPAQTSGSGSTFAGPYAAVTSLHNSTGHQLDSRTLYAIPPRTDSAGQAACCNSGYTMRSAL